MAANSKIEWTHHTFNPWRGCTRVSEGCRHCYAETMSKRFPKSLGVWGPRGTRVVASRRTWNEPRKWDAEAKKAGERRRVFCASMADVFEDWEGELVSYDGQPMGTMGQARALFWGEIARTPWLDWLLLTKRPENIAEMVPSEWLDSGGCEGRGSWPSNVWPMCSIESMDVAVDRLRSLWFMPARPPVYGISFEPLLGPIRFDELIDEVIGEGGNVEGRQEWIYDRCLPRTWGIIGVESNGPRVGRLGLRDDVVEADWYQWAMDLVEYLDYFGARVFVKQCPLGGKVSHDPSECSTTLQRREFPEVAGC